jgi:hypothetical protein
MTSKQKTFMGIFIPVLIVSILLIGYWVYKIKKDRNAAN